MVAPNNTLQGIEKLLASPIEVRAAIAPDVECIAAMLFAARREQADGHDADDLPTLPDCAAEVSERLDAPGVFYLLATRANVPIGFVRCRCFDHGWLLDQAYVSPTHRRNGVLPTLLAAVDRRADAHGFDSSNVSIALDAA